MFTAGSAQHWALRTRHVAARHALPGGHDFIRSIDEEAEVPRR